MKRKLLSLICSLAIFMSIPVFHTGAETENNGISQKIGLIYALGITDNQNEQDITLKNILKMMSRIYQKGDMDPIEFGVMMQMIDGSEKTSAKVSPDDALRYAVITLGYRLTAERNGGTAAAYRTVAQNIGLTAGVSLTGKTISYQDTIKLIDNMLAASPMVRDFDGGEKTEYKVLTGETMLSHRYDVKKMTGIVTATPITSLYGAEGCANGIIAIDAEEYSALGDRDYSDLLGKRVKAYLNDDGIVYMYAEKNTELMIDAKDLVDVEDTKIRYDSGSKEKTVTIEYPPKVIFNGRFYSDYTDADLKPEIGSVRLVDNNENGRYEVVFVESYQEMIVSSRTNSNKIIYGKKLYTGALEQLELEGAEEKEYQIIKNKKEATFGELAPGDVLLVAESKDHKRVIIDASSEKIEGKISSWDRDEMEVTVSGTVYRITNGLLKTLAAKGKTYDTSKTYQFSLNSLSEIAYMEEKQELNYYLYYKSYCSDDDPDTAIISYMDMNNEWKEAKTAKNVSWEDGKCSGEVLVGHLEGQEPQLAKMEFNSKGEVKSIELATQTNLYQENKFTKTSEISGWYYAAQRTIDYSYYANNGAKILELPVGEQRSDKSLYQFKPVESRFRNDKWTTCRAYDIDEYNFADIFTVTLTDESKKSGVSSNYFLITKVLEGSYEDENVTEIVGMVGRFSNFSYYIKDQEQAAKVKRGMLVQYHVDDHGIVDYISPIFNLEDDFTEQWNLPNGSSSLITGTIALIDTEKGIMKLKIGGSEKTLILTGTNTVMFYDKKTAKVRIASLAELHEGNQVVINGSWHKIAAMYCVE